MYAFRGANVQSSRETVILIFLDDYLLEELLDRHGRVLGILSEGLKALYPRCSRHSPLKVMIRDTDSIPLFRSDNIP